MFRFFRPSLIVGLLLLICRFPVIAAESPSSWRNDATLRAVTSVGRSHAWAVGDHGAVWRTIDGGKTWKSCPVPEDVSLESVCFLTGRVGWVAGGGSTPYTEKETGVVYFTRNGGQNWKQINQEPLPRIQAIRFFSDKNGVAAGAATPLCPSGVLRTADGGKSWTPYGLGTISIKPDWRDAAFSSPSRGFVVGYRGRHAAVGDDQLLPSRGDGLGYRNLNAVVATGSLKGWAAGDGGTVLSTSNGGIVWESAVESLSRDVREIYDFQAIAAVGDEVWAAGNPGGLIWHSADRGKSWEPQPTGCPLPIFGLTFSSPEHGIAVGAMGMIIRTIDGGASWRPVRATDRRAALMVVAARPQEVPFPLLATLSGDQGYRSVTLLPVRHDLSASGLEKPSLARRARDAVLTTGGNAGLVDWPLPVAIPGIEQKYDALLRDWNRRTEGRLQEVMLGRLVAAIRTWRPEVIVFHSGVHQTACDKLIKQALDVAIQRAGDPTRFQSASPHLPAWTIRKLYVRTDKSPGDTSIDITKILSRLDTTVGNLSDKALAHLGGRAAPLESLVHYHLIQQDGQPNAGPFFAGLALPPDSPARRPVEAPREDPQATKLANKQRMIRNLADRILDDSRQAAGLLAQIEELSAGLAPDEAARQLLRLGNAHRERIRWNVAEETYMALIRRYPQTPASHEAALWLLRLWTGAEPVWRRIDAEGATSTRVAPSVASLAARIQRAKAMSRAGVSATTPEEIAAAGLNPAPPQVSSRPEALRLASGSTWELERIRAWRQRAVDLLQLIHKTDPSLFASDDVQSTLALLQRTGSRQLRGQLAKLARQQPEIVPAALIRAQPNRDETPARAKIVSCQRATSPPHLDAEFSDSCWQSAEELTLRGGAPGQLPAGTFAMMAHDNQFLYLALSIPRVGGRPVPPIQTGGRTHDADTSDFDRIQIRIDVDLDRVTAYQFTIDERSQTAERCWEDTSWNPQWYVAAAGDPTRWRLECAIPFAELGPNPPRNGTIWGLSIGRIVPAIGVQGWPAATVATDPTTNPGRIRFK